MERLELADGRTVEYLVEGPAGGAALVLHAGTPAGAVDFPPARAAAARHGLRLITPGRPGYGGSTRQPGRTVADVAADVAAILDAQGIDRFVTVGMSGGGPHALACAALLPDRCRAAATLAGVAPFDADGLDFLDGMGAENLDEFGRAAEGEAALTAYLEEAATGMRQVRAEDVAEVFGDLLSPVDRDAVTGEIMDYLANTSRYSVSTGVTGWLDDDLAFVRDWGFALDGIRVPVAIWQGDQDRMVPPAHGHWLGAHVPGAEVHFEPGQGHVSLFHRFPDITAGVLRHLP